MNSLVFAIIGHLVGDYLLQNDWMAAGKKRHNYICAVHCLIWTAAVLWFAGSAWWLWWVPFVLFATHYVQDRTGFVKWYMHTAGQGSFASPPMAPWSLIAVDNTMHIVVLGMVAKVLG